MHSPWASRPLPEEAPFAPDVDGCYTDVQGIAMAAGVEFLHAFPACSGRAAVLGPGQAIAPESVPLVLAGALAEREAVGEPIRVVVLRLSSRDDAAWAAAAMEWLETHGRRVLVRTPVVLSEDLIEVARRWGSTILLELAHVRPAMQAALAGPGAEPVSALLFHAQHLRRAGLEVAAVLAPLLPVVHDRDRELVPLLRHIVAADLRDAHLSIGRLGPGRLAALEPLLAAGERTALLRAFDLDPLAESPWPEGAGEGFARLSPVAGASLYHAVRRNAEAEGLRVDACGCPAQCHLDPELTPAFVAIGASDLFADVG
jgi:hypothetical protein